jgi:iron-sulfur cluster protein
MSAFGDYKKEIMGAAHNERIRLALSRAVKAYRANVDKTLKEFPQTVRLAEEVREIKESAIARMEELAGQACRAIEANHGKAYIARTADDALNIIGGLVGTGKLIVKAKSMTSEEIGLREHLEEAGNEVYETDLGEFIVQKLGSRPMHILAPAVHVPKEDVAKLLSEITGEELPVDVEVLVATARRLLREKFFKADIGISGSNVVAAETGSLFLIENEGNIRLATGAPPVHIALVGMEKLVPTLNEAWKVAEVTWRYANYTIPPYVSVVSGPSCTGDIEKVITYGAHGPREFHVIFLDGGRTKLARHPELAQLLYCLRCGGCLYECPVFGVTAGHFGDKYFAGIGAVWAAMISGDMEKAAALAYTCLTCGRCKIRCPMAIDVPEMVVKLRKILAEGA